VFVLAFDHTEDPILGGWELGFIGPDRGEFGFEGGGNIDDKMARGGGKIEIGDSEVIPELFFDRVDGEAVEFGVPFTESGIKDGGIGDLHGLPMVGGGHGGFGGKSEDDPGAITAKDLGEGNTGFVGVEEAAIGEIEGLTHLYAEDPGGSLGFLKAMLGAGAAGGRFAVREVNNPDSVTLLNEEGNGASAADLDVVGMCSDGDDIKGFGFWRGHGLPVVV